MTTIQVGSAVRVSFPGWFYDGKSGVVIEERGRMNSPASSEDKLYLVDVKGCTANVVLGERHLSLLRPDLERFIHSTRFALTGDDVVHVDYPGDISTCQSCGTYADAIVHKSCPSCGGYLG